MIDKPTLSVVLATRNEEGNIASCLETVSDFADEIIVVDEESTDKTQEIAKKFGAHVVVQKHEPNFHITKQNAINLAKGNWILQLDADERLSKELAAEISMVIRLTDDQIREYILEKAKKNKKKERLFERHQRIVDKRDGAKKNKGEIAAFYLPRVNYFLGKPLIHGGVYPDGVIRLFKRGKAYLPTKSVHEQMKVDGEVAWLYGDLEHHDSPTFSRYLARANRYTDITAEAMKVQKIKVTTPTLLYYSFVKPGIFFLKLYIRHLGILDGMRGFFWSLFSALHFPISYFKYYSGVRNSRT